MGWLVVALLVALALACGLGWLAARERRERVAAEAQALLLGQRLDTCTRSLELRDAELAAARAALVAAQSAARAADQRAEIAALADQQVAADLVAALAARRRGLIAGAALVAADTAPDLTGLGRRESGLPSGAALPAGVGGVRGAGRDLTR